MIFQPMRARGEKVTEEVEGGGVEAKREVFFFDFCVYVLPSGVSDYLLC